jgi:hypothetical protein
MKILSFFLFFGVIYALLDPDPKPRSIPLTILQYFHGRQSYQYITKTYTYSSKQSHIRHPLSFIFVFVFDHGIRLVFDSQPDIIPIISHRSFECLTFFFLKALINEKRGRVRVVSFDRSPFQLFSLKCSNKSVQVPGPIL